MLLKYGGEGAVEDWYKVVNHLTKPGTRMRSCLTRISDSALYGYITTGGLSEAAQSIPSLALREDAGAVFTLSRYWRQLLQAVRHGRELNDSFAKVRDQLGITNKFVLNWLDMLCFLLQGLPADGTLNAVDRCSYCISPADGVSIHT